MLRSAREQALTAILAGCVAAAAVGADGHIITVTDADINAGDNVLWTADHEYHLDGFVFVEVGATLTIDAGTVIKGLPGAGEEASALIISRGARIYANGTRSNPIIFTGSTDDVTDLFDVPLTAKSLWGGLIVLGNATNNNPGGEGQIEGVPDDGTGRGLHGGDDDDDSSGVLRYVSIRHGGTVIGADNEINGLSLASVGRGTLIDYVEIFSNFDDGIEFFGGTVDTKHLVSAFCGDDAFDYDEGFRGRGQYWLALMPSDGGERACECDGGVDVEDAEPFSIPTISNATLIGSGADSGNDSNIILKIRDNAGAHWSNSIFTDFGASSGLIDVEDRDDDTGDSFLRLAEGDITVTNTIFHGFAGGTNTFDELGTSPEVGAHLAAGTNSITDPMLRGISRVPDNGFDPRPAAGSPALSGAVSPGDAWFDDVDYVGAFGPDDLWIADWTFISQVGILTGDTMTLVAEESAADGPVPGDFALEQNYPNPFNPSTTIRYSVPFEAEVKLGLYNAVGQQIATLVRGVRQPGTYSVSLDASDLSSGTYYYRLDTGADVLTRSLTLLK